MVMVGKMEVGLLVVVVAEMGEGLLVELFGTRIATLIFWQGS